MANAKSMIDRLISLNGSTIKVDYYNLMTHRTILLHLYYSNNNFKKLVKILEFVKPMDEHIWNILYEKGDWTHLEYVMIGFHVFTYLYVSGDHDVS